MIALAGCAAPVEFDNEPQTLDVTLLSPAGTLRWFVPEVADSPDGHPDYRDHQTFIHFANTNANSVDVQANFYDNGLKWSSTVTLPAQSRTSVHLAQLGGAGKRFATGEFYSKLPNNEIQVSATVLNNADFDPEPFWEASKAVNGATEARTSWFFGEGGIYSICPAAICPPVDTVAFDHWYIVYNPNNTPITATYRFLPDEFDHAVNHEVSTAVSVNPQSRSAFNPMFTLGPQLRAQAAHVQCSAPCFVQMIMNQLRNVPGRRANSQSTLGSKPATTWYVIGIPTTPNWHNRIYFFNTVDSDNWITLRYRNASGADIPNGISSYRMKPLKRSSYDLNSFHFGEAPGLLQAPDNHDGGNLSLEVTAQFPIVLTKITYWLEGFNWSEGASTTGHSVGGPKVILPGGNIGGGFTNLTQIMNVGTAPTTISATTYFANHIVAKRPVGTLNAKGVMQLNAAAYLPHDGDFATVFESSGQPIVAESTNLFGPAPLPPTLWRSGDTIEGLVYPSLLSTVPIQP